MNEHVVRQSYAFGLNAATVAEAPLALETRRIKHSRMFGHGTHAAAIGILVIADAVAFFSSVILAALAAGIFEKQVFSEGSLPAQMWLWGGLAIALCCWFAISTAYTRRRSFEEDLKRAVGAVFLVVLGGTSIEFALKSNASLLWLSLIFPAAFLLVPLARVMARRLLDRFGLWRIGAAILGSGDRFQSIVEALERDRYLGYRPTYRASLPMNGDKPLALVAAQLSAAMYVRGTETAILVPNPSEMRHVDRVIDALNLNLVPYILVPPVERLPFAGLAVHTFFNSSLILMASRNGLISPLGRALKRAFDIVVSAAALLFLAPFFLVVSALVASSGQPIFFGHQRVGRGRQPFRCLKFRTMVVNSDEVLQSLLAKDPVAAAEWNKNFKLTKDPRITPIGRFLRKTSLDELPQLFNVLRGEMSLVGPRPVIAKEIAQYYGEEAFYYELVRPGLTGLWQVSGRSSTSYARRVFLDSHYVRNWSMWTDIAILFNTVPSVLAGKGAV